MSRVILLLLGGVLLACDPFVAINAYFCGPNRACPDGQVCNDSEWTCGAAEISQPFACPEGGEDSEPDDDQAQAVDLGETACGDLLLSERPGCIPDSGDVDVYRLEHTSLCERRNDISVLISFPAAFVPIKVEVKNSAGQSMGSPVDCGTENTANGRFATCVDFELEVDTYFVEVSALTGDDDCAGNCQFNLYGIDIRLPP